MTPKLIFRCFDKPMWQNGNPCDCLDHGSTLISGGDFE